jgi:hypothetical protein
MLFNTMSADQRNGNTSGSEAPKYSLSHGRATDISETNEKHRYRLVVSHCEGAITFPDYPQAYFRGITKQNR